MSNYSDNKMVSDPNHVWNKLANLIPDGSEVLDIGCSSGNFGAMLVAQKGCTVDGVEPDKADAKVAAKKMRQVWLFDIENPDNVESIRRQYDVLVFADVLEHLVHPEKTLRLVKTLVKPGGRVVFSLPNMAHVSVRLALLGGEFTYTDTGLLDKTHLHFYDLDTVQGMFKKADMRLTNMDGVIYGYPDALIHSRLKELGFTAREPGMARLRDPRAAIFQFVGSAEYDKRSNKKEATISQAMPVLSQDIQNLVDELQRKQEEVKTLSEDNSLMAKQLTDVTNSKAYKVGRVVVKPGRIAKAALQKIRKK